MELSPQELLLVRFIAGSEGVLLPHVREEPFG